MRSDGGIGYANLMEPILSHTSALQFHRTPPIVHELVENYPSLLTGNDKRRLVRMEHPFGAIEKPLHLLVPEKRLVHASSLCVYHSWTQRLPPGAIEETDYSLSVTSPLFTTICLASVIPTVELTMLIHELVGTFSVYRPPREIREELQRLVDASRLPIVDGWRPSLDTEGKLTDLWQRPPLLTIDELRDLALEMQNCTGVHKLNQALKDVHGIASSPLEVQSSMLLGMSRRKGGWGLGPFEHNKRIVLSRRARTIARQNVCTIDLYIEGNKNHGPIAIECQGGPFHDGNDRAAHDDNRALALQSMGITLIRLRGDQIYDAKRLEYVAAFLAKLLNKPRKTKSASLKRKELELRASVLIDWWTLGSYSVKRAPQFR